MIGTNIKKIRKNKGLSLTVLAEKANISKSYLSNLERNLNGNPSIQVVEKLAEVLQVKVTMLLSENCEPLIHEEEWIDFVKELKTLGLNRYNLDDYKIIFEFIRWKKSEEEKGE
ncbi:helix-turn-helix domain-containing protein [Gracilibacillus marinus]|jgi:XRE family transcriptional regulator, master regulator for biofilm formation|uniref:Helix-turn-helix domain-containing protein n=1 Tax=Gracilibacillus marinus TaxID=630535 RepID=A0ABV8VW54_9BACI